MAAPEGPSPARALADLLIDVGVALLAGVALLLGLSGPASTVVAAGCGLLALVVLAVRLLPRRNEPAVAGEPLGQSLVLRTLPVTAAAVALAGSATGPGERVAALLAASLLVGALACEPVVGRVVRFQVPVAVRLPDVPEPPRASDLGRPAVAAALLGAAAGLVLAALGLSPWWWLAASLLAVVPIGVAAVQGRAKVLFARRLRRLLPAAVAAYAPEFLVYTSRPDDASYQILMWLPYLERAGLRFLVVTRNAVPAAALAEQTALPVVEARGTSDLEGLVVPSVRAAFYVNASSGNGALVRFQHLTHVYLGHGDSDKPPSYNPTHAMYDQVFAAGPAATRRYAAHGVRVPAEKFRIVGRPQVEQVQAVTRAISEVEQPVVLYAPTWRGHVEETMLYSLPAGESIVAALLDRGATVIFRPHPFSYDFPPDAVVIGRIQAMLAEDARRAGRPHLWGAAAESERGILDCINASDAMVSDVSSVASDYLFSGKPFAMVAVPAEPAAFVAEFPIAAASYVVRGDLADLEPRLTEMLGADPLRARRQSLRIDYLGDFEAEHYADAFVDAVRHVSRQPREDADAEERSDDEPEDGADAEAEEQSPEDDTGQPPVGDQLESAGAVKPATGLRRYGRLLAGVGLDLLGTALALLALALTVLGAPVAALALVAVAALAAALQSETGDQPWWTDSSRLLTRGRTARTVLVAVLGVLAVDDLQQRTPPGWALTVALLGLVVALAVEEHVRSAWSSPGLVAVNLPGALAPSREVVPRGWLALAGFAALLVALPLLAVGATPGREWGVDALAVVATLLVVVAAVVQTQALRRATEAAAGELRLRPALTELAPAFAVYFASPVGASYQLGMWLPYFARLGRPFVVVTRTVPMLRQVAELCTDLGLVVPVVHRPTLRSLEEVIVPSMTTAFYVNNAVRNTHFIERRELTHVWLNHGDSEKPACYNPVHAIYDLIFAAGQAGVDRYARHGVHIPAEKFRIVGRPQVEQIEPARGPVAEQQPPTVLYAPTWQGPYADTRVYSLPLGAEIVQALLDRGVRVVFRAHPFNYRYDECRDLILRIGALLDADRRRTGRQHLWGEAAEQALSVEECFNLSDAMISDVSAVVSDYLHSAKPFAMVSVGRSPEQLLVEAPAAQAAYVLREDLSNLAEVLQDLLGADPLVATRDATRVYYLGDFDHERYADGFLQEARRVIDTPHEITVGSTAD